MLNLGLLQSYDPYLRTCEALPTSEGLTTLTLNSAPRTLRLEAGGPKLHMQHKCGLHAEQMHHAQAGLVVLRNTRAQLHNNFFAGSKPSLFLQKANPLFFMVRELT